jgi:hypothetical protein
MKRTSILTLFLATIVFALISVICYGQTPGVLDEAQITGGVSFEPVDIYIFGEVPGGSEQTLTDEVIGTEYGEDSYYWPVIDDTSWDLDCWDWYIDDDDLLEYLW